MTADEKIAALLAESQTLSPGKDSARLVAIYEEAASLVDRSEKPKKWAAFRYMYGQAVDPMDPRAALAAYREAVACLDPVADRAAWTSCTACIGFSLAALGVTGPPDSEELIASLEAAIEDFPYGASTLATYYQFRTIGDPLENWTKQVRYLELALGQMSAQEDAVEWARLKNTLAVSLTSEPDGDFAKAVETRIGLTKEALAAVAPGKEQAGSAAQNAWILISADMSEAYLNRVGTDALQDRSTAEQYARAGYAACGPNTAVATRATATMALARVLLNGNAFAEGLRLCVDADGLIDAAHQPVLAATNLKFKALAHLRLLERGDASQLEGLVQSADAAYALLDPVLSSDMRRTVMQLAAEGLLARGEFIRAIAYLQRAVQAGESNLARSTTQAGRLERIFDMHESYAQLAFCLFRAGQIPQGLEALDSGKGRLWRPEKHFATFDQIKALVPKGGALLFAAFAPDEGAVVVVTEHGESVCPLPGFGRERLKQLLLGDILNPESESWLSRYIFRDRDPERWHRTIDAMGGLLFSLFWTPVLKTLDALGINAGAELVLFPQGGLGVLPLHAAYETVGTGRHWIGESFAIRYAPSASCLVGKQPAGHVERSLIVSDPLGDLTNSALEVAWVRDATSTVLAGKEATKKQVLSAMAQVRRAHFSTHAVFRVDDPFASGLLMAEGEILTLAELLPLLEASPLSEVTLSGCETAMAQVARRPDELLGFPAAFLEHGAATVIATQWPVDDRGAAVLAGRFYSERGAHVETSSAGALQSAQNWMRQATVDELLELLLPLKNEPEPVGGLAAQFRTELMGREPEERPFAHPYFWAPFTVSGL